LNEVRVPARYSINCFLAFWSPSDEDGCQEASWTPKPAATAALERWGSTIAARPCSDSATPIHPHGVQKIKDACREARGEWREKTPLIRFDGLIFGIASSLTLLSQAFV
jgi:hypothetical protein